MEIELEYYGGDGFGGQKEIGNYEIKYDGENKEEITKSFTSFIESKKFYDSLKVPKAFWDLSYGAELIDCWYDKNNPE